jgi:hypothetical protein
LLSKLESLSTAIDPRSLFRLGPQSQEAISDRAHAPFPKRRSNECEPENRCYRYQSLVNAIGKKKRRGNGNSIIVVAGVAFYHSTAKRIPRTFAFAILWPRAHAIRQTVATGFRLCFCFYALVLLRNHSDRELSDQLSLVICCRNRDSIVIVVRIADYCRPSWIVSRWGPATVARTTVVVGETVAFIEPGEWPFLELKKKKEWQGLVFCLILSSCFWTMPALVKALE